MSNFINQYSLKFFFLSKFKNVGLLNYIILPREKLCLQNGLCFNHSMSILVYVSFYACRYNATIETRQPLYIRFIHIE